MPENLTIERIQQVNNLQTFRDIFENCIQTIKLDGLLEAKTGKNYTQEDLANHIGSSSRKIGYCRSGSKKLKKEGYVELFRLILNQFTLFIDQDNRITSLLTNEGDFIAQLAGKLALNLIDISTSFDDNITSYEKILNDPLLASQRLKNARIQRERFIAIVGAGASNAATQGKGPIPTSKQAIIELRKAFKNKVDESLIDAEIKHLSLFTGRSEQAFETQLLALNKFSKTIVRETLKELCGNENTPCLTYEILGHMLKHRLLDVVINFNYDELLDNAIKEELPDETDYKFIYTAGHCPNSLNELRIDKRIKKPIYIKCHGTISQPNSLRLSEEKSFTIEEAIQIHIAELLKGEVPPDPHYRLPINLLIFGFSFENHTLNQLIERALVEESQKITLWIFDTNKNLENFVNQKFNHLSSKDRGNLNIKMIHLPKDGFMDVELTNLWNKITDSFKKPYRPRGIARHQFVNHIFKHISPIEIGHNDSMSKSRIQYYKDRLYVELFILTLKSNGIVHLSQITNSRVGKFLMLIKREGAAGNIHEYMKDMGLKVYEQFMYDTYLVSDKNAFQQKDKLIDFLHQKLIKRISLQAKEAPIKEPETFFDFANEIRKRRLLKVNPKYQHVHDNLFPFINEEEVFNTSFAWIYNYRLNIEENIDKWDLMLAISEEGSFLFNDASTGIFDNKHFELILASFGVAGASIKNQEKLSKLNLLSDSIRFRPWWLHNKHLVLFLKRNEDPWSGDWEKCWDLIEGYFYRQNMLSQRVNPVKISEQRDLKKLLYIYAIYWHGSQSNSNISDKENTQIKIVAKKSQLDQIIKNLLLLHEDKLKK